MTPGHGRQAAALTPDAFGRCAKLFADSDTEATARHRTYGEA